MSDLKTYAILYKAGTPTLPEALARIEKLEAALRAADTLNGCIAGAYTLSLADFRYLNNVTTAIRAALARPQERADG